MPNGITNNTIVWQSRYDIEHVRLSYNVIWPLYIKGKYVMENDMHGHLCDREGISPPKIK